MTILTAGIADIAGPYDVSVDGVKVGEMPLDGFGHILAETFTFAIDPLALLDGMATVTIGFTDTSDLWAIDYSEITASKVPTPATIALFGLGLIAVGFARRRNKA